MKNALSTVSLITTTLSLLFAIAKPAWSTQVDADPDRQASHRQPPAALSAPVLPRNAPPVHASEMQQLKMALERNREETAWVHELLQQAGETLYWAQTRHEQNAATQRALADQLASVVARYEARQAEVAQLGNELKAAKAALPATDRQAADYQARIAALENERDQLREALENRDQQLALMDKELQATRAVLQQAQAEMSASHQDLVTTNTQYQTCQNQHRELSTELNAVSLSEADAQQALVKTRVARDQLEGKLGTCTEKLAQAEAEASFASMETVAARVLSRAIVVDAPRADAVEEDTVIEHEPEAPTIQAMPTSNARDSLSSEPISLKGVKFRYDSAELTDESRAILEQVARTLRQQPDSKHEVAGHTDAQGHPAYNIWLSQQRAEAVRAYLILHGVKPANLKARGYGGTQPVADNRTWEGLSRNRRVELRWTE